MRNRWRVRWVALVMLGFLPLVGCTVAPSSTVALTGGLKGVVSDAGSGAIIPGAQVTVAGQAGVFTLTTDSDGEYEVDALPAGAYLISVQATGYYVNVLQVGVAANVASTGDIVLEPAAAAVAAAPADAPTATATTAPTRTPTPTDLPSPTPTPGPTAIPVRAASAASPSPAARAAPVLLAPHDGSIFSGPQRISFLWEGPCCLAQNEYYVVSIPHPLGVEEAWVKTTEWLAPDYLYLLVPESRELTWSVSVRRHTGEHPNGQWKGPIVSSISETWRFQWRERGGGGQSPVSTPQSPLPVPSP